MNEWTDLGKSNISQDGDGHRRNNLADFVWLTSWEYIVLSYFICEQKWTRPAGSTVRSDKVVNIR